MCPRPPLSGCISSSQMLAKWFPSTAVPGSRPSRLSGGAARPYAGQSWSKAAHCDLSAQRSGPMSLQRPVLVMDELRYRPYLIALQHLPGATAGVAGLAPARPLLHAKAPDSFSKLLPSTSSPRQRASLPRHVFSSPHSISLRPHHISTNLASPSELVARGALLSPSTPPSRAPSTYPSCRGSRISSSMMMKRRCARSAWRSSISPTRASDHASAATRYVVISLFVTCTNTHTSLRYANSATTTSRIT